VRFALAVARFYDELADRLEAGARRALEGHEIEVLTVPGAFELPLTARLCADTGRFDGIVCLGAVIRGETDHYDWVCQEAARGIQTVQLETRVPCGFGILTVDTYEQALARSGEGKRDSGAHAAHAVLAQLGVRETLTGVSSGEGLTPQA
jgi:6,7-dimethyl-8-ribityllumazine synthase